MDCFAGLLVTCTFAHRAPAMYLASGLAILCLQAQPSPPTGLHFEVASVRRNQLKACSGRWGLTTSHGKVTAENAPLLRITSRAFGLTDDLVSGPGWLNSECYDINAKASSSSVPDRDLMSMLQDLLKERFHLLSHYEPANRPAFDLVVDEGGVKMHPDGDNNVPVQWSRNDGRTVFAAKFLRDLCERLGTVTGRPVVDKTGLAGRYFIVLAYLPPGSTDSITGDAGTASDPSGDIFSAVREQLGLRILPRREPVGILKIDNIEKIPTGN
jgi:uncharacterized protein (TIGR03435 family)